MLLVMLRLVKMLLVMLSLVKMLLVKLSLVKMLMVMFIASFFLHFFTLVPRKPVIIIAVII